MVTAALIIIAILLVISILLNILLVKIIRRQDREFDEATDRLRKKYMLWQEKYSKRNAEIVGLKHDNIRLCKTIDRLKGVKTK